MIKFGFLTARKARSRMRLFTRLTVCAAAAVLLSAVLYYIADLWFGENESVLEAGRQIVHEARRKEALLARKDMISRCLSAKRDIIDQLIAGHLHLHQAITQFQQANELVENDDLAFVPAYQTPTDPEGVGRQVLL